MINLSFQQCNILKYLWNLCNQTEIVYMRITLKWLWKDHDKKIYTNQKDNMGNTIIMKRYKLMGKNI